MYIYIFFFIYKPNVEIIDLYHTLGKFSRQQIDGFILLFPENRIKHFKQTVICWKFSQDC